MLQETVTNCVRSLLARKISNAFASPEVGVTFIRTRNGGAKVSQACTPVPWYFSLGPLISIPPDLPPKTSTGGTNVGGGESDAFAIAVKNGEDVVHRLVFSSVSLTKLS